MKLWLLKKKKNVSMVIDILSIRTGAKRLKWTNDVLGMLLKPSSSQDIRQ